MKPVFRVKKNQGGGIPPRLSRVKHKLSTVPSMERFVAFDAEIVFGSNVLLCVRRIYTALLLKILFCECDGFASVFSQFLRFFSNLHLDIRLMKTFNT